MNPHTEDVLTNAYKPVREAISYKKLPGPKGLPVLGNLLQLKPKTLHRTIEQWSDVYGAIFLIRIGVKEVVVVTDAESIQQVLKNRPDDYRRFGKMDEIIREVGVSGVFNAEGDAWRRQRKLFAQALSAGRLKTFFPKLKAITETLLQQWRRLADQQEPFEIRGQLMRYTVNVTSRLAFGYEMNTFGEGEDALQSHLEVIFPAIFKRLNAPVPYWRYVSLPADKQLQRSMDAINAKMQEVITAARQQLFQKQGEQHAGNFLEALLSESDPNNPVSNDEVIGNVLTMLMAGEDTTAHTISWIFYFLHLYPQVQEKIRREVDEVLGTGSVLSTYDDASRLTYIEAVAMEAMRLKPVAPILFTEALKDVQLQGVSMPKGTAILLQTQYAGLKDDHFSRASEFLPERWMQGCPVHNDRAFLPFGAGPRFCPGYQLAMLEIKMVISMVCKNFQITMTTDAAQVGEQLAFTMMPGKFYIVLKQRQR